MGLLDSLSGLFGKKNAAIDALKDGKLDVNDLKDAAIDQLDSNGDGKLDAADLDINQDGKTDLNDLETAKDNLKVQ